MADEKVTKLSVNYRIAAQRSNGGKRCANCSMFLGHSCTLVRGSISPFAVCDKWEPKTTK